jgi:hypothetical protein
MSGIQITATEAQILSESLTDLQTRLSSIQQSLQETKSRVRSAVQAQQHINDCVEPFKASFEYSRLASMKIVP